MVTSHFFRVARWPSGEAERLPLLWRQNPIVALDAGVAADGEPGIAENVIQISCAKLFLSNFLISVPPGRIY